MNDHRHSLQMTRRIIGIGLVVVILVNGCNVFKPVTVQSLPFTETIENYPQAEVILQTTVPLPLLEGEKLLLEFIDEVTGAFFNPTRYEMIALGDLNYEIHLPLTIGVNYKYRYIRQGSQIISEYTALNTSLRYRLLNVQGPILVHDSVIAWADLPYSGPLGRIRGQLLDQSSNVPLVNMVIHAAGMQTISAADGSFILENLPVGTHNMVIASLDGAYQTFEQGAMIAADSTTPVQIRMQKRALVDVNFEVKLPEGFSSNLPLRLASNLTSLGFTDIDLPYGSSTSAANLPVFKKNADNTYSLALRLPAGTDLRYKFTFGDGVWNAELTNAGTFFVRELVVPTKPTTIRKAPKSFTSPGSAAIHFEVNIPATTPETDTISLQLDPFGWMQPLPMMRSSESTWHYTLYTPTHFLGTFNYRFCRNDQCDQAVNIESGSLSPSNLPQNINVIVTAWQSLSEPETTTVVDTNSGTLSPRPEFIAGVEFTPTIPISWKTSLNQGVSDVAGLASNWVILRPTWSISSTNNPLFEPLQGIDLLWPDLQTQMTAITAQNMQAVLFPTLSPLSDFWQSGKRDTGWWQTIFDRYHRFILQNADMAELMQAGGLIIGDPFMRPSMSGGSIPGGDSSNPPDDADEQWIQLITDVRARYHGPILGAVTLPNQNTSVPTWIGYVDALYVIFAPSFMDSGDQSVQSLVHLYDTAIDELIAPIEEEYQKSVILGVQIPSNSFAVRGCVDHNGSCMEYSAADHEDGALDLDLQAKMMTAALISSAGRPWIIGFIARGYHPYIKLQDEGPSIYGKPAYDVLWFWYHYLHNTSS